MAPKNHDARKPKTKLQDTKACCGIMELEVIRGCSVGGPAYMAIASIPVRVARLEDMMATMIQTVERLSNKIDSSLVKHGQRQGLLMLGITDGIMEVLNSNDFAPTVF